jgi:FKBP-type peptidyl-prolyl cis-trans isomerase
MKRSARWLSIAAVVALAGCQHVAGDKPADVTAPSKPQPKPPVVSAPAGPQEVVMPSGLKYVDLTVGTGTIAEPGMNVSVHYTGWLTDGTKFDSSLDRGQPITFRLGAGQVVRGWDEGIAGMRVGGKRKLTVPPELGYGPGGRGPIPPNSTMLFDVELISVR